MTKKKKVTKNQFKKGNQASKGFGRPPLTDEEKALQLKNRTEWRALLDRYMIKDLKELKALKKKGELVAIDAMVVQSIINAVESGNTQNINWHLDHSLGKPKEVTNIKVTGNVESMKAGDYTKEELLSMKQIHDAKKKREK